MVKRLIPFVLVLGWALAAAAGSEGYLNGCVVDGSTGAPVSGAMITIREPLYPPITNYTDSNGCTTANQGGHEYQPHIQVDVEAGSGFMPWYGYVYPTCTSYPASPPYVLCEFVIELVPRLSISGQVSINFRHPSANPDR